MEATLLDAAVIANRRNTPQAAIDKRTAPRYSIGELNAMDWKAVQERFERLPKPDTRPGIVRFLDIIDLPRNAIANGVTAVALPRAREAAIARGDFDDLGMPKVWGSDILRGLGLKNQVVNGVAGFGLDIAMDPLSWVGGPIGGMKTAGAQGTKVAIGRTGELALRKGLKSVARGEDVADDALRRLLDTTAARMTKGSEAVPGLSTALLGDVGGAASKLASKAGLGTRGFGGDIAELFYKPLSEATDDLERAQIQAVRDFVGSHTLNRGVKLGDRPGTALAHVPLTDVTIYGPAFTRGGHDAVMQRAFALAGDGNGKSKILADLQTTVSTMGKLAGEIDALSELQRAAAEAERAGGSIQPGLIRDAVETQLRQRRIAQRHLYEQSKAFRGQAQRSLKDFADPETMGDLLSASWLSRQLEAQNAAVQASTRWRDAQALVPRATKADVTSAREVRHGIARQAEVNPEILTDQLAPFDSRVEQFEAIAETHRKNQDDRLGDLLNLRDRELRSAERVASAFGDYAKAAQDLALLSNVPMIRAMGRDDRMLVRAANRLLGMDDEVAGTMRLAPFSSVLDAVDKPGDMSARVATIGKELTQNFGLPDSVMTRVVNRLIATTQGHIGDRSRQLAGQFISGGGPFTTGLRQITANHGLSGKDQDAVMTVLYALATAKTDQQHTGFWQTLVNSDSTPLARRLQQADTKGVLQNKALMADLDKLADESASFFRSQGDVALREGYLNFLASGGGYTPVHATREFAERIERLKTRGGVVGGVAGRASQALSKEPFQRAREFVEVRYRLPDNLLAVKDDVADLKLFEGDPEALAEVTRRIREKLAQNPLTASMSVEQAARVVGRGEWQSFTEIERTLYGGLNDRQVAEIRGLYGDAAGDAIEQIRETSRLFDRLNPGVDDLARSRVFGRPLDAFELNERFDNGVLQAMAGGSVVNREVFETNLMDVLVRHGRERAVADAKASFVEGVVKPFIIPGETLIKAGETYKPGEPVKLANGQTGVALGGGRVRIGPTVYRQLPSDKSGNAIVDLKEIMADGGHYAPFVPEAIAAKVERFHEAMSRRNLSRGFRMADSVTKLWRVSTLSHPSWMTVNAMGNAVLLSMAYGPQFKRMPSHLSFAAKALIARNNPERLRGMTVELAGRKVNADDLLAIAGSEHVTGSGQVYEAAEHLFSKTSPFDPKTAAAGAGATLRREFAESMAESAIASVDQRVPGWLNQGKRRLQASARAFGRGALQPMVRAWFTVNGGIDDTFRLAALMAELDRGADVAEAAASVRHNMLNFQDLTRFETDKLRPLFPFYSWIRASLPNMLSRLITDPEQFSALPKLQEAIEELSAGEEHLPRHMRPRWIQEQLGIQIGHDPETRKALTVGTILPQEQAIRAATGLLGTAGFLMPGKHTFDGQDLMDFLDFSLSQTSPILKAGIDLANQREGFSGRSIGAEPLTGDISASEYLLGHVRWLRELGIGSQRTGPLIKSFDESLGSGIGRLVVGGRMQPLDEERLRFSLLRDMRKREEGVRRAIRIAQREGNESAEREARVKLLAVYRDHLYSGGAESDVPVWAREQLEALKN